VVWKRNNGDGLVKFGFDYAKCTRLNRLVWRDVDARQQSWGS